MNIRCAKQLENIYILPILGYNIAQKYYTKSSPFIIVKKFNHNHWFALNVITITLLVVRYDSITLYSIQANNWGKVGMKNWNINSILAIKLHPLFYRIFCTFDLVVNERIKCQLSSQLLNVIGNLMTYCISLYHFCGSVQLWPVSCLAFKAVALMLASLGRSSILEW